MIARDLKDIYTLKPGDVVRNKGSQNTFVVTATYGDRATAVRTVEISNPEEWEVLSESRNDAVLAAIRAAR